MSNCLDIVKSGKIMEPGYKEVGTMNKLLDNYFEGQLFALYFSAHWCPPCRNFTPTLAAWFKESNSLFKEIDIVFISSDKDEESMKEYYNEMPWHCLPFGDERINKLKSELEVNGIPMLCIFTKEGKLITKNGRTDVEKNPETCLIDWNEAAEGNEEE